VGDTVVVFATLLLPIIMTLSMDSRPPSSFLNIATLREGFEEPPLVYVFVRLAAVAFADRTGRRSAILLAPPRS